MILPRSTRAGVPGACPRLGMACLALMLSTAGAHAQQQGFDAATELVDPKVLRVCADPHNLPFSNEAGEGFENKLAELLGRKLGRPVVYTYYPQVIGFYRSTLNAYRCDVVIGVAVGDDLVKTTSPYYHTTYALVFKPGRDLDGVRSLEDPRLHDKRIGVVAGTPPATIMTEKGLMARAKPYPLTVDTRVESPARNMVRDIVEDRIDAGVLWGPIAGFYANNGNAPSGQLFTTQPLTVVPLIDEKGAHMDFRIAMGVRRSDQAWKQLLDQMLQENQPEIDRILSDYGVPLLDEAGKPRPR
jgi:mxaJ protein